MPDDTEFTPQNRPGAPSAGSLVPSPPPLAGNRFPRLGRLRKCRQPKARSPTHTAPAPSDISDMSFTLITLFSFISLVGEGLLP